MMNFLSNPYPKSWLNLAKISLESDFQAVDNGKAALHIF